MVVLATTTEKANAYTRLRCTGDHSNFQHESSLVTADSSTSWDWLIVAQDDARGLLGIHDALDEVVELLRLMAAAAAAAAAAVAFEVRWRLWDESERDHAGDVQLIAIIHDPTGGTARNGTGILTALAEAIADSHALLVRQASQPPKFAQLAQLWSSCWHDCWPAHLKNGPPPGRWSARTTGPLCSGALGCRA